METNAKSIGCTHILGYRESVIVKESIMILSATGTAIKVETRKERWIKEHLKFAKKIRGKEHTCEEHKGTDYGKLTKH